MSFVEECADVFGRMRGSFVLECADVFGRMRGCFWKNAWEFLGKQEVRRYSILYACILHKFKLSNDRFSDFAK